MSSKSTLGLLIALLERPGQVVTRDELRKSLWPQDTYVDFDRSLHTAVAKLGEALGDSAESHRFVETLPRRGYRFLAGVELLPLVSAGIEAPRDIAAPHPEPRPAVSRQTPRRRLKLGAAALALVLAGAGATWWWIRGTQPAWEPASQFTLPN